MMPKYNEFQDDDDLEGDSYHQGVFSRSCLKLNRSHLTYQTEGTSSSTSAHDRSLSASASASANTNDSSREVALALVEANGATHVVSSSSGRGVLCAIDNSGNVVRYQSSLSSSSASAGTHRDEKGNKDKNNTKTQKWLSKRLILVVVSVFLALAFLVGGLLAGILAGNRGKSNVPIYSLPPLDTTTATEPPLVDGPDDDEWYVDTEMDDTDEDDDTDNVDESAPSLPKTSSPSVYTTDTPTGAPTSSPTTISAEVDVVPIPSPTTGNIAANKVEYSVAVYYYPGDNFHDDQEGYYYFRKQLVPRQFPFLGEYSAADPEVIAGHIQMLRRAHVNILVTSWGGPNQLTDLNTKNVILGHQDMAPNNMKVALHYQTSQRLQVNGNMTKLPDDFSTNIETARADVAYMCEHYFDHPNYYRIDGRPVLVMHLSQPVQNTTTLEGALMTIRSEATQCGHHLYLIGDQTYDSAPDEEHLPFWYFDAVTNNDVYSGSRERPGGFVGKDRVDSHYSRQADWKSQAFLDDCRYIPTVSPGFNDRAIRPQYDHPALSRRLNVDAEEGSLFYYQLQQAKKLVDPAAMNLIFVNSFNDWNEDTQIEPVALAPAASWPQIKTQGLEYVGYGNLYLDILGASTVSPRHQGIFDYLFVL